jgi:HD-GYP domain-containing protein (c-di-GMP phosphodiesterase class II)
MTTHTVQVQDENDLVGCRQIQRLLGRAGIVSAFYRAIDGNLDTVCTDGGPKHPDCEGWPRCQQRMVGCWSRGKAEDAQAMTLCERGYVCLRIEVKHRRRVAGFLVCCLKNLRYRQTEALERLGGRLRIDVRTIVDQGLKEAIDAGGFCQVFQHLLPDCIEKARQNAEQRQEIEAVTRSLSQSYEEINLLHRITDGMTLTRSPAFFFEDLCEEIRAVVESEKILILWHDGEQDLAGPRVIGCPGPKPLDDEAVALLWRRTQHELRTTSGILLDGRADQPAIHSWPDGIRNVVSVPIRRDDKILGAVAAINKQNKPDFDSIDTKLLISVANELAVYLENFRLYGDLRDLLIGSLRALTSSIDAKDPYTCGHSERVAVIARWIAEKMALSAEDIHAVYLTGLLHDVGKIGVSEAVLRKPGRLLPDEFEQIKQHPQIGSNILSGIRQMADVSRAVLTHHERFDGKGYPMGLRGDQIPLAGRIVKLADSFDAMVSDRIYRGALPVAAALAEIRRYSGTQFDPVIADIILKNDLVDLMDRLDHIDSIKHTPPKLPIPISV